MDSNERSKVIAFDTLFCTNHIQMLKVILPYMDNQIQKSMAVYIKLMELNYTIEFLKKHPYSLGGYMERESSPDIFKMCSELLPYCTENEKKQLEQIRNIFQSMEMYKEMSKTMDMMKDFIPDMSEFMNFAPDISAFAASGPDSQNSSSFADFANTTDDSSGQNDNSSSESERSSDHTGSFDIMNLLMNMLTPEQKQMYEIFGGNHHAE